MCQQWEGEPVDHHKGTHIHSHMYTRFSLGFSVCGACLLEEVLVAALDTVELVGRLLRSQLVLFVYMYTIRV